MLAVARPAGFLLHSFGVSDVSAEAWIALATAVGSGVAGIGAATAAALSVRLQRRWGSADAFLRVAEVFENDTFRRYKSLIYGLDRSAFASWTEEETNSVNTWCAQLDLVAALIRSKQLNKVEFFNMYGDVVLRTIYQVSPYCNYQLTIRGKQFLLPLRLLTADLIRTWRRLAVRRRYPLTIGFPAQPHLRVNPDLFNSDDAVLAFRVGRRII